jgi:hypothetical protein
LNRGKLLGQGFDARLEAGALWPPGGS